MDILLNPLTGWIVSGVASMIAVKVNKMWRHSSRAFHKTGKKGFDALPSFWQGVVYKLYTEALMLFPEDKVDKILDWVELTLSTMIKGKIDDVILHAIREELRKKAG